MARRQADDLAPRIDRLASSVRRAGGVVIHAPSQTEPFYESSDQFIRAREAATQLPARRPRPNIVVPRYATCPCAEPCPPPDESAAWPWPWRRQHPVIEVAAEDFVACEDGSAVYGIIRQESLAPIALCGLHLDQCVLDRPFGAKALWVAGVNVMILGDHTEPSHPDDRGRVLDAIAQHLPVADSSALLVS